MKTTIFIFTFIGLIIVLLKFGASLRTVAKLIVGLPLIMSAASAILLLMALAPSAMA